MSSPAPYPLLWSWDIFGFREIWSCAVAQDSVTEWLRLKRPYGLRLRMSDGSLVVVRPKKPWAVGDRAYLPQLKVFGVIHKVHGKGLGEIKRDDGVIHGVRLSDLRRAHGR